MTALTMERKAELSGMALVAAIDDDGPALDQVMDTLAADGWHTLYGACCAFAAGYLHVCPVPGEEGGMVAFSVVDGTTGQTVAPEQTDVPREVIAGIRIIAAIGNNDFSAAADLFYATVRDGFGNDTVSAVLALAATGIADANGLRP